MKPMLYLTLTLITFAAATMAQTIPKELWGKWVITREIPTATISCWDESQAKPLIGTELEYSAQVFRWKDVVTRKPGADAEIVTSGQFHDENSGKGVNSSQVTFRELGIKGQRVKQIRISHPDAQITTATTEIPGDTVIIKDGNTIIFSVCNTYFEAKRHRVRK